MTDDPAKIGRPPKTLSGSQYNVLTAVGAAGGRLKDAAVRLGMSSDTLRRIRREDPKAEEAWAIGRSELHHKLVSTLIDKALGGETVPLLFALKTLFGYVEGQPLDGGEQRSLVTINLAAPLSPDEYESKLVHAKRTLTVSAPDGDRENER